MNNNCNHASCKGLILPNPHYVGDMPIGFEYLKFCFTCTLYSAKRSQSCVVSNDLKVLVMHFSVWIFKLRGTFY